MNVMKRAGCFHVSASAEPFVKQWKVNMKIIFALVELVIHILFWAVLGVRKILATLRRFFLTISGFRHTNR